MMFRKRYQRLVISLVLISLILMTLRSLWKSVAVEYSDYIYCDPNHVVLRSEVPVFVITPTYKRMTQIPDMIRLGQTLKSVPNLLWIICEDAGVKNAVLLNELETLGVKYEYYLSPMPDEFRHADRKPKGVANRMKGLEVLLRGSRNNGVIYFADDDNTYHLQLFDEVSSPIVHSKTGKVLGFYDVSSNRTFAMDMAGFSVNLAYLKRVSKHQKVAMPYKAGREENGFLSTLNLTIEDLEPLANKATRILVWHTRTEERDKPKHGNIEQRFQKISTNIQQLQQYVNGLS